MSAADLYHIDCGAIEWAAAWEALAALPINAGIADPCAAEHPESGEVWQYMGSDEDGHCFRHRCHPATGKREYRTVPWSVAPKAASAQEDALPALLQEQAQ